MQKIIVVISVVCFLFTACKNTKKINTKPNVIIILSDDQGWGDFSFTGNTNIQTPNIDQIASRGANFTNFYVQPVCSPTRAELLTGRYSFRGGVRSTSEGGERLDIDETTIGGVFKKAGYATAAYGKWHNGMQHPYHPNARGFDDFYGFCSGHWGNYFSPMLEHNGKIVQGDGFIIDDLTNHGLEFIEQNKDNPFLLYLPYNTPHGPMQVPDKWWDKVKDREINMLNQGAKEDIQMTRAALALCENIDWNVGRINAKLEELGIEENTIIIYFNDNGPNSWRWNGGMKGKKGFTDEGGVRSVLFFKWKSHIDKQKISQVASVVDLLPTLTELCGIDFPAEKPLDGKSLKPLLFNLNNINWEDRYIVNFFDGKLSLRNQRFRLDVKDGLYDIENDRGQEKEISEQFPDIKANFLADKEKILDEIASELPEEDTRPFYFGYPGVKYTQIPARDGVGHGEIQRSNRWPNCSFFTNWINLNDSITWNIEVAEAGTFKVQLYYTCPQGDEGSEIQLSIGDSHLKTIIRESFESEWLNPEKDRYPRENSFSKNYKILEMGEISVEKGKANMTLKALTKTGDTVMDFRLMMFERI